MHMVVRVLVFAKDAEEAVKIAGDALYSMCGDGMPFDYYNLFDNEAASERWGELPVVMRVCNKMGTKRCDNCPDRFKCYTDRQAYDLLEEGIQASEREFYRYLTDLRKCFYKKDKKKLIDDGHFRYLCYKLGEYGGSSIYLYNEEGEGIRSRKELEDILVHADREDEILYIIPADVHY